MPNHKRRRLVQIHECVDDRGNPVVVEEYQTEVAFAPLSGPLEWRKSARDLITDSGDPVNFVSEGVFQLVLTDMIVRVES